MNINALVPELSISDFERSLTFYTQMLGFSIEYQRPEEGFAFLSLGNAQIMIDQVGKGRTWKTGAFEYPLGRGVNLQIEVEGLATLLDNLAKHNIELFSAQEGKWYQRGDIEIGQSQFLVQDPDGYLLRFFESIGSRLLVN